MQARCTAIFFLCSTPLWACDSSRIGTSPKTTPEQAGREEPSTVKPDPGEQPRATENCEDTSECEPSRLIPTVTEEVAYDCTTDEQCRLSFVADGTCCRSLCVPFFAYTREFADTLEAHNEAYCSRRSTNCPVAICTGNGHQDVAVCVEGRCTRRP